MINGLAFFSLTDVIAVPLCLLLFYFIIRNRANRQQDFFTKRMYYRAFYFKIITAISFTLITVFYFKGGDTVLYFHATKDLNGALTGDGPGLMDILTRNNIEYNDDLFPYFFYDDNIFANTHLYMYSPSNFFPGKFALIPYYIFGGSYLCINIWFSMFALGGAIRLYKSFYYFYPHLKKELALACLFLPGVTFWSSSLLKDPITFGAIGYILYAIVSILFKKKNFWPSLFWIALGGYFLFSIKIYILLVLVLSMVVWFFAEFNKKIKDRLLRNVFTALTFIVSAVIAFMLLNYLTSLENAKEYKLDDLLANAEVQRDNYAAINQTLAGDSHFKIGSSNPALLFFNSIVATLYRPFLWEINTPIALLSAFESLLFLFLTLYIIFKNGIRKFFGLTFSDGRILMCFVFAFVFAFAVGSSTANFGALSRYKIPCIPYYLIFLILLYDKQKLPYPQWFNSITNFAVRVKKN